MNLFEIPFLIFSDLFHEFLDIEVILMLLVEEKEKPEEKLDFQG